MSRITKPPDLKSVAAAKGKVAQYVGSKETNNLVKKAILEELNSHFLSIKPEKLHGPDASRKVKKEKVYAQPANNHNPYYQETLFFKRERETKTLVPKHGQKVSSNVSKIPRPTANKSGKWEKVEKGKNTPKVRSDICSASISNYDWNGKGRIIELKIRYLARKYLHIWVKKVFGRVAPSTARFHYERRLMKRAFEGLEDLWWSGRKGWKLNIRAEYHNRYRLWKIHLKAWKMYLVNQREKKRRIALARKFGEMRCQRRYFDVITRYCLYRKSVNTEQQRADRWHCHAVTRFAFRRWLEKLRLARLSRSVELVALAFWAHKLKSKIFERWKFRKLEKTIENEKIAAAGKFNDNEMRKKSFYAWKSYVSYRRQKNSIKEFAARQCERNLKRSAVKIWFSQLQRQIEIKELHDRIRFTSTKFIKRAYFIRWMTYISDIKIFHFKTDVAVSHCNRHLKTRYFKILQAAVVEGQLKEDRASKALAFRKNKLMSAPLRSWLMRCEHSEELKLYPLTKVGRAFHRQKLLKKCFNHWMDYREWKRRRKAMLDNANKHFEARCLPKYFSRLCKYVKIRKAKKERNFAADDFNRELLYAKVFYTWLKQSCCAQDSRLQNQIAIMHHEGILRKKALEAWRQRTTAMLLFQEKEALADAYFERTVKAKYFKKLKANAEEEKTRRGHEVVAMHHKQSKTLLRCFISWKSYTEVRRTKSSKQRLADAHFRKILLSKMLCHIKIFLDQRRVVKEEVERRQGMRNKILLRWVLKRWRENIAEWTDDRLKTSLAVAFASLKAKKEVFFAWRNLTVLKNYKRWMENCRVQEIRKTLDLSLKRRVFFSIFEHAKYSRRAKQLNDTARVFYDGKLKLKCLKALQQNTSLQFKKMLLKRQSEMFHLRRNLTSFFQRWKQQYGISVQERNRTNVVLWWWSTNLQRKAIGAWKKYLEYRKMKKIREHEALWLRRENLMENCLQQWISYSTGMMAFRSKIANARQIEGAIVLQERVRRCAALWHKKTFARGRRKAVDREAAATSEAGKAHLVLERVTTAGLVPTVAVLSKERRPPPRKPDYLRGSFDLGQFMHVCGHDEPCSCEALNQCTDESHPRQPPPLPSSPSARRLQEKGDSLLLAISSGEDVQGNQPKVKEIARPPQRVCATQRLLPPSSFQRLKVNDVEAQNKNAEDLSKASNQDSHLDVKQQNTSSSAEEYSSESEDSFQDEEIQVPANENLLLQVAKIKDTLVNYQKQQKRLRELKSHQNQILQWISSGEGPCCDDRLESHSDFHKGYQLCSEIQTDIEEITDQISKEGPTVKKLAKDVQILLKKLNV